MEYLIWTPPHKIEPKYYSSIFFLFVEKFKYSVLIWFVEDKNKLNIPSEITPTFNWFIQPKK